MSHGVGGALAVVDANMVNSRAPHDDRRRLTDSLVDKQDFREFRDEMREGFKGVHERQDKTNGRLLEVEKIQFGHTAEIKGINGDLHRRHEARRSTDPPPEDGPKSPITRRDVTLVIGTAGTVIGVFKGLAWLIPLIK